MKHLGTMLLLSLPVQAGLIFYDGQDAGSSFVNTAYDPAGMTLEIKHPGSHWGVLAD